MKTLLALLPLLSLAATLQAASISLVSSAATTANNQGVATVNIPKNPKWADPFAGSNWVSIAQTGDPSAPGYTIVPNGTTVLFSQSFTLLGPVVGASLSVMADDTTSVSLNGTQIYAAANPAGGFPTCSADPIGCLTSTAKSFNLADFGNLFQVGINTLSFGVVQKNSVSFGLDYAGRVDYTTNDVATPEPASLALLGSGLLGLGMMARRKRIA